MELLHTYSISRNATMGYSITFYIPDNCEYKLTYSNGNNLINIDLKKGQTVPSTKYESHTLTPTTHNNVINIEFEQKEMNTQSSLKKPRIRIDVIA
jgi:hypothetical protein